jgi:tRNA pseudouridine38-40 synthase
MKKYALCIEYDGSRYSGWQRQHHSQSVQENVERALSIVADGAITVVASGRTDAGVHAVQQCAHFETDRRREHKAWVLGVNANLPNDISVRSVTQVTEDFHARYSTVDRSYRYLILNSVARSALLHQRVAVVHQPLDAERMHKAAQCLVGEHDFSSFRAAGCQARHATREIFSIAVSRHNDVVELQVCGNAFLHNMIRIIIGSLIRVGDGTAPAGWLKSVLEQRDRTIAGKTADACGLYFLGPTYEVCHAIPHWRDAMSFDV